MLQMFLPLLSYYLVDLLVSVLTGVSIAAMKNLRSIR
jgi:hypothetical protein